MEDTPSISNTVLQMVLAQANEDQNQHYPPSVFETHYDLVTHWLIDESAKRYPGTQSLMDLINPYIDSKVLIVKNGVVTYPDAYRHLLGFGLPVVPDESKPDCSKLPVFKITGEPTDAQLEKLINAKKCNTKDVDTVSIGRWNKLVTHAYKKPTPDKAIVCSFKTREYRICPFETQLIEARFIIKTKPYKFGYSQNEDDTYYFEPKKTTEALWDQNAISYLFKGVNILYSNYVRDPEQAASAKDLRDSGIF